MSPRELLADKGYDSDDLRAEFYLQGSHPIIPWRSNRKQPGKLDRARYAKHNLVERMFERLKDRHCTATSCDRCACDGSGRTITLKSRMVASS
jgi:transposase